MAAVTPQLIKELRELTSAGMMDCKNALNETGADIAPVTVEETEELIAEAVAEGDDINFEEGEEA